jgi:hypothetical protein
VKRLKIKRQGAAFGGRETLYCHISWGMILGIIELNRRRLLLIIYQVESGARAAYFARTAAKVWSEYLERPRVRGLRIQNCIKSMQSFKRFQSFPLLKGQLVAQELIVFFIHLINQRQEQTRDSKTEFNVCQNTARK